MIFYVCIVALFVASCHGQIQSDSPRSAECTFRNGYFKSDGSCDAYIECRDFVASTMYCPDGLHFDPAVIWPAYPCGYPMDVPCIGRGTIQPAKPTTECPHQYGFFPHPNNNAAQCSQYRMCVAGKAIDMECPVGLAFSPSISRCDWPDMVPSCNVEQFFGYKCPAAPLGADGKPLDIVLNYKYEGSCYYFFSCERGRARLLSCDSGLAFDGVTGRCVDADLVRCEYNQ